MKYVITPCYKRFWFLMELPCTVIQSLVKEALPEGVERFDQCRVPLAVSAFDVSRLKTRILMEGNIAPALRATCTFPGLFSPVWHPKGVLIDGGVSDSTGTHKPSVGIRIEYFAPRLEKLSRLMN